MRKINHDGIKWKDEKKSRRFDWIGEGGTFEYKGKFFIKIKSDDPEVGAVCLHNGHEHHFDANVLVTPVKNKAYAEEV